MNGEPMRFTNIPGKGPDWSMVEDFDTDRPTVFDDGGSYSRTEIVGPRSRPGRVQEEPSGDLVQQVQADWADRDSFEKEVFKQIGGNPFTLTADDEINRFAQSGGYEEMFNEVFDGHISWRNRAKMTPHQKDFWNKIVLREHAAIEKDTASKRQQMKVAYDHMMGKFDQKAKDMMAAKKTVAVSEAKIEKAKRVALEKQIKEQKALSKSEKKASLTSLRKLADNTKGYDQGDMRFWKKDSKGRDIGVEKTPLEIQEMNYDAKKIGEPGFATIEIDGETFHPRIPHLSEETTSDDIRRAGKEFAQSNPDLWPEYRKALSRAVTEAVADGTITRVKADELFGRKTGERPTEEPVEQPAKAPETMDWMKPADTEKEMAVATADKGIDKQIKDSLASLPEESKNNINKMFAGKLKKAKTRQEKLKVKRQMLKKIKWIAKQPGSAEEAEGTVPYKAGVFADR
jgi:hypothetical protein